MSNQYNAICGHDVLCKLVLKSLNLKRENIPRFRDAILGAEEIAILTRSGGRYEQALSNPEGFKASGLEEDVPGYNGPWNDDLKKHPCFKDVRGNTFDDSYLLFLFKYPEEYKSIFNFLGKARGKQPHPIQHMVNKYGSMVAEYENPNTPQERKDHLELMLKLLRKNETT